MKTLEKLTQERNILPILATVKVQNGIAYATNQDFTIIEKTDIPDGMYCGSGVASDQPIKSSIPMTDFPSLPATNTAQANHTFSREFILDDLFFVSKAQSTEETRYYLNGIYFHDNVMVATDGHRAHRITLADNVNFGEDSIVPRAALKYLFMLVKENRKVSAITLEIYPDYAEFTVGDTKLLTRLVDGTFPDYQRIFPVNHPDSTPFVVSEFKDILKRIKILNKAHDGGRHPFIKLLPDGKAQWRMAGTASEDFTITPRLDIEIGFNCAYLADTIDGTLSYDDPTSVIRIDNDNRTVVVMPVRA